MAKWDMRFMNNSGRGCTILYRLMECGQVQQTRYPDLKTARAAFVNMYTSGLYNAIDMYADSCRVSITYRLNSDGTMTGAISDTRRAVDR